jgi:hypothetical protein
LPVSRRRRGRVARAARTGNLTITNKRKKTNKLYLIASLVIAVLVIASFAFASFSGGGGHAERGSAEGYVDGVGIQVDIEGATHVVEGTNVDYQTSPPASGDHWPTPGRCGFFEDGLPDERVVHNMEHGNIVVNYNLPLASDVSALRNALDGIGLNNIWGVARAYDGIPTGQVALSTWGIIDTFVGIDRDRISRFFEAYSGGGPEGGIPC